MKGATSPGVVQRVRECLEDHSPVLRDALRATLTERTFPPHPRFKGRQAPSLDQNDALCGVHVEYSYPGWVPAIFGLSRAAAMKCGARYPFDLRRTSLLDADLDAVAPDVVAPCVENWISREWRAVRDMAPELRGYVSIHDGIWRIDMDTGEAVRQDVTGMGWL